MLCGNCGKEIPNEARFCTNYEAKVAAPQSPSEEASGDLEAKLLGDTQFPIDAETGRRSPSRTSRRKLAPIPPISNL